jgi:hypothetical protein
VYLLALALVLSWSRQQHTFEFRHFRWPVHKLARFWDALKTEDGLVFSKV